MKYTFNLTNHCDFNTVEKGRLAPRAYFVPQRTLEEAKRADFRTERRESGLVTLLSGEWDFKYYKKKSKLPKTFDSSKVSFDKVNVPSTWQRTGYESPVYLNCPYGFDPDALGVPKEQGVKPPELPEDFSCGVYRKKINIESTDKVYIITFLGVSPCVDLYVNGEFVGYGEASHNSYEFDITKHLKEGENEIVAVVFKWCNGSYLEAQDMFRENGIFRDVLLYAYDKTYIFDYEATAQKNGKKYDLFLKYKANGKLDGKTVKAALFDGEDLIAEKSAALEKSGEIDFKKLSVSEWSAEIPRLYELYITLFDGEEEKETVRAFVGFRDIKIDGTTFLFNGQKIKLKGVNHHDTHETKGYAMGIDDLERDVRLMKEYNVNCVRTSHYPPDPIFLTLCDVYGLYLVDEADIETHGLWHLGVPEDCISHNLKWAKRYTDRVRRMYMRDRTHPCIIMWSLGNESMGYKCHDKCYKMLKEELKTNIPVHYEGVCHTKRKHYDVFSEMYTHPDELKKVRERKRGKEYTEVPFYLCEYCHAMGMGPGALEEYMRMFESDDIFMGGCIWEWADHSVRHVGDGFKYEYTYGGDHGEKLHDECFCVDGLFYPDRTPHTGALEMKEVYRPLRVRRLAGNSLTLFNTNFFKNSSYIEVYWEYNVDGETESCGSFSTDIDPRKEKTYKLPLPKVDYTKNIYLDIYYINGDFEIAKEQLTLSEARFNYPSLNAGEVSVSSDGETVTVNFDGGKIEFSEETGEMTKYEKDGVSVLNQSPVSHKGFTLNLTRAYMDNDRVKRRDWEAHGLKAEAKLVLEDLTAEVKSGIASVSEYISVYGEHDVLFNASVLYIIGANGIVDIEVALMPCEGSKEKVEKLPRLGLTFEADKSFSEIEYFGRGENECLSDCKAQSFIGLYCAAVKDEHEPYIRPQDNMNHCDTSYLKLKNENGDEILIYSDKKFTFNVHNYSQTALYNAEHREDLKDESTTFVTLDGFTCGTGTGSCGPNTLPEYEVDATKELDFNFVIVPIKK